MQPSHVNDNYINPALLNNALDSSYDVSYLFSPILHTLTHPHTGPTPQSSIPTPPHAPMLS